MGKVFLIHPSQNTDNQNVTTTTKSWAVSLIAQVTDWVGKAVGGRACLCQVLLPVAQINECGTKRLLGTPTHLLGLDLLGRR